MVITDPQAIPNAIRLHPQLGFAADTVDALHGADCVVLVTERREYRQLDLVEVGALVRTSLTTDVRTALGSRHVARRWLGLPQPGRPGPRSYPELDLWHAVVRRTTSQ